MRYPPRRSLVSSESEAEDGWEAFIDRYDAGGPFESFVFDAEPLIAHAAEEEGHELVSRILNHLKENDDEFYVTTVGLTEIECVLGRGEDEAATEYIDWMMDFGFGVIGVDDLWSAAARWRGEGAVALGDAYALAAAESVDGTLVAGDGYDGIGADVFRVRGAGV